jgi:hypothetical protein
MRQTKLTACALAAAGMLTASALGQSNSGQQQQQQYQQSQQDRQGQSQQRAGQRDQAPDGFVLIDERVVMLTANEPQSHFLRAAQYIDHNDARGAAAEVRIAAAYLDMQASRAKKSGSDQELTHAADRLRQVADELHQRPGQQQQQGQQGQQKQEGQQAQAQAQGQQQQQQGQKGQQGQFGQQLTRAFAQADQALAKHFQAQAQREIDSNKAVMAGHDLDAAASSLKAAIAWSGQRPSQDVMSACQDAERVAMQLLMPRGQGQQATAGGSAGSRQQQDTDQAQPAAARIGSSSTGQQAGRIPDDAKKVIDQLGSEIQKVGSQIQGAGNSSGGKDSGQQSGQQSGGGGASQGK